MGDGFYLTPLEQLYIADGDALQEAPVREKKTPT